MNPPRRGETVQVMRDGRLHWELFVHRTEPGDHKGWYTIHGAVPREGGPFGSGSYFEQRSVYAELQEDGTVRMLSNGERISPASG